jgi:hypothetical protein
MAESNVVVLPVSVSCDVPSSGGEFLRRVKVSGSDNYPMKGGQGDYQPRDVLLVWTTADGVTWTFRHAIIAGPRIETRNGKTSAWFTSQTLYLGDPTYADCEPVWLPGLVAGLAPGQVIA